MPFGQTFAVSNEVYESIADYTPTAMVADGAVPLATNSAGAVRESIRSLPFMIGPPNSTATTNEAPVLGFERVAADGGGAHRPPNPVTPAVRACR